jgi:DnaJ-class molecular chaperone
LCVKIEVIKDEIFIRKNNDIFTNLDIEMSESVLGCKKIIETIWGEEIV